MELTNEQAIQILDNAVMQMRLTREEHVVMVKALDTTLTMTPGSRLNLGGLRLASGELVVVISVS